LIINFSCDPSLTHVTGCDADLPPETIGTEGDLESTASMSLNLVLAYENSALTAPQSFRDGMQAAANILDALIRDNITVTIRVGYGDWNNQFSVPATAAEGGDLNGSNVSYTNLKAALASHETSAADQTFVNSLPTNIGKSTFYVPSAGGKSGRNFFRPPTPQSTAQLEWESKFLPVCWSVSHCTNSPMQWVGNRA
jgi:hypothetical protein